VNGLAKSAIEGTANSSLPANLIVPQTFLPKNATDFQRFLIHNFLPTQLHGNNLADIIQQRTLANLTLRWTV